VEILWFITSQLTVKNCDKGISRGTGNKFQNEIQSIYMRQRDHLTGGFQVNGATKAKDTKYFK
jgi:type V secretory pathway adhesin AidA